MTPNDRTTDAISRRENGEGLAGVTPATVLNSDGRPVALTEEGAAAFLRWFDHSKIVHPTSGLPLVLFHGTRPGNDITHFRLTGHGHDGLYFTPDPTYAESYTCDLVGKHADESGPMYPVYLSIKNPFVVCVDDQDPEWERFVYRGYNRQDLIAQGFDGAVLLHKPSGEIDQVMAFFPEQIKSAIGNPGTYDPNDPHLTDGHEIVLGAKIDIEAETDDRPAVSRRKGIRP
jgi:hypothetical protein